MLHTIQHGACINFERDRDTGSCAPNLASTKFNPAFIDQYIHEEIKAGRMFGPFDIPPFPNFRSSPVGLVPKDSSGWRLKNHLSFGGDMAINHSIAKMECKMGCFDEVVDLIHMADSNHIMHYADDFLIVVPPTDDGDGIVTCPFGQGSC